MTLFLSRSDVAGLLEPADVLGVIEQGHADLARGGSVLSAPGAIRPAHSENVFLPMGAASARHRLVAMKLLGDMPGNRARGLSTQRSTVMLVDADSGECVAVLDGREPTRLRTAAASAVATRHLARPDASVLGLVGAGALAVEHLRSIRLVRDIERVLVWSRSADTIRRFLTDVGRIDIEIVAMPTVADVVSGVDILCTLTPSREPVVEGAWMSAGLHVNAVGAPPRPDHREIDTVGMKRARIVVDSRTTVHETGDLVIPLREGALTDSDVAVELGEVVAGLEPGRSHDEEITLFKSVGIGLQDLEICRLLLDRARGRGVGADIDLTQ